ncbi:hypothetical protein MBLNU459_g3535t1 [Dothideomycetes sp. NU459]
MRAYVFFTSLAGLLNMVIASAKPEQYQHFDCGVDLSHASSHFNQTIRAMHEGHHVGSASHKPAIHARGANPIVVNTAFHVVTKAASQGSITPAMVTAQLNELNAAYNPHNIKFKLVNTTYTVNDAWAVGAGPDGTAMKQALRTGTYSTLNIYFQTDLYGSILGTCTLPTAIGPPGATPAPTVYLADGCNVQANTMPGGAVLGYNQGKTAVHETGHWLGLLHTFEGYSCAGPGDFVADTPPESASTDGCPVKPPKDSCPGAAGVDPIHNYMDYSTDACYESFTPLQQVRMAEMWAAYRLGR